MNRLPSSRSSLRPAILLSSCLLLPACAIDDGGGRSTVRADLALGIGKLEHRTSGTALDGRTDAGYFALGVEGLGERGLGYGLRFEGIASDTDLFRGAPVGAPSDAGDGELFLHGTGDVGDASFSFPIRFGASFRSYTLQENATGSEVSWSSFGPRLELAPDLSLFERDGTRWSLTGRLGAGVGATLVSASGALDDWDTTMGSLDLGLGTRLTFRGVRVELGFLSRRTHYAESDPANSATILAADTEFEGLVLTFAATF